MPGKRDPVPDLRMRPVTRLDQRVLVVQAAHPGTCPCLCCLGTATLADVQDAEASLGIRKKGPAPRRSTPPPA